MRNGCELGEKPVIKECGPDTGARFTILQAIPKQGVHK